MFRGDGGCALLIVPEARPRELVLELGEPRRQRIRVKGNHGPSPAGPRSPRAAARAVRSARSGYAPWHFLNFLPLPHQHGSLRPSFSFGDETTVRDVAVDVEPPLPIAAAPATELAPAAAIASAPAAVSCAYEKLPFCACCAGSSSAASCGAISAWKSVKTTSSRISRPSSSNMRCPSCRYSTSGSFCANNRTRSSSPER